MTGALGLAFAVVVHRRAPAIAPAALGIVELAPATFGRAALFDGVRGLGRVTALLGGLLARLDTFRRLFVKLLGDGRRPSHSRETFDHDAACDGPLAQRYRIAH